MKKFKILIIDDQSDSRTSLEEILASNDFEVKTATDRDEALQLLDDEIVDLIYLGFNLAFLENFSICRVVKSNSDAALIPVIVMIGHDELSYIHEIFESGADDYIIKPLISRELLVKSSMYLELKYSRQMARNMNQMLESVVSQRTTELEDSLKKLRQANKDLETLEISKSEFFNLISHEIRTPLNGIMGSLALIERAQLPDEINRYFSLLDHSVKRLEKFSNTILEASILRIRGKNALMLKKIDLVNVIDLALDQCISQFREKNIQIDFQKNITDTYLKGDQKYLLRCFEAVLENAFKFSPKGGKVEICINGGSDGYLKISVTDRGKGFSQVSLDHLFSALSNLAGHFDQNTGMGLHLAKLIVDAHSGSIKVGNLEPSGAFVELLIPSNH